MAVIQVSSNILETQQWMEKIKMAIKKASKNMTKATGRRGQKLMEQIAPQGVRTGSKALRKSAMLQLFQDQAILYIRKDNETVALVNELGMKTPKFLYFEAFPELRSWAEKKYPHYNQNLKGLKIGGPNTYLGTKNVFWYPLFERLGRETPYIMAREIEKELNKIK